MQAVRVSPTPDALFALRAAIDGSPLRLTLIRPAGVGCSFASGLSLAYDPSPGRLAEGAKELIGRALTAAYTECCARGKRQTRLL